MKIAMMGSGGVGGYFGARMQAKGTAEVSFIARGPHLAAMRANGLVVESPLGRAHVRPVAATDDPAGIGPVDAVVIGVKLWATEEAARACRPLVGPETVVVSLQNGVEADDVIAATLGAGHLIGGVAYIAASIEAPGVIRHVGAMQRVVLGELDGRASARVQALHEALAGAGVDAETSADIRRAIWEKFAFLVGLSATTTLLRQPIGAVRADPDTRALLGDAMAETVAVGRAKGVAIDPGYVERRLAFIDGLDPSTVASMRHDLDAGNRLEVAWLSGGVARMGAELGVPTPVNRVVYAALKPYAEGRKGPPAG